MSTSCLLTLKFGDPYFFGLSWYNTIVLLLIFVEGLVVS